ncbi:MAG: lipoyl(octanoyl) transferase LipB [Polyangia bacterium]
MTQYAAHVLDLGTREYGEVYALQRELVAKRQRDEIADTLVLVEHPDVITTGRSAHRENLLATADIPLFDIERGGDVTYHGPGQLVGYPIFQLRESERDLHRYLRNMEEALIQAVARFGVAGDRKAGWTGVWTVGGARKLASIGIAVKRWVTMHGFALNVSTDLARFGAINPCGLDASVMASVSAELGRPVPMADMKAAVRDTFADVFGRRFD